MSITEVDASHVALHTAVMDTEDVARNVKRAKSEVEDVQRGLSSLRSYIDMNSQHGSYVYSQLNHFKSKLDDAETKLRRALRDMDS